MKQNAIEHTLDVRDMPPRQRHPTIFNTWAGLEPGRSILIVNDHDPVPLYYQYACEYFGGFYWEYLERGPETWQVRIRKGDYPDPGFVPVRRATAPVSAPIEFVKPLLLDTRPIFASGGTPCGAIDNAVANLIPGQPLILVVPFEPVPLCTKLGREGFSHRSEQIEDGAWRVEFRRDAAQPATAHSPCCCSHE